MQIVQVIMENIVPNVMPKIVLLVLMDLFLMKKITSAVHHQLKIIGVVYNMRVYVPLLVLNVK